MKKGFTLIELLVVVAIIGLLSSIVFASLNLARDKGKVAAIKSNLRNMIPEAELAYITDYSTACTAVTKMLSAITSAGATSFCYSYNNSSLSDVYQRWGASGIIYSATPPVRAWSASNQGVVTWDAQGVNLSGVFVANDIVLDWVSANNACTIAGGRLPTLEELKTLIEATYIASGNTTRTPPGFNAYYWSSTIVPSTPTNVYYAYTTTGNIGNGTKATGVYVRCVR